MKFYPVSPLVRLKRVRYIWCTMHYSKQTLYQLALHLVSQNANELDKELAQMDLRSVLVI